MHKYLICPHLKKCAITFGNQTTRSIETSIVITSRQIKDRQEKVLKMTNGRNLGLSNPETELHSICIVEQKKAPHQREQLLPLPSYAFFNWVKIDKALTVVKHLLTAEGGDRKSHAAPTPGTSQFSALLHPLACQPLLP